MTIDKLEELINSDDAPNDRKEFSIWLHDKIIFKINYELWNLREDKGTIINSGYAMCNFAMSMESLKTIKQTK